MINHPVCINSCLLIKILECTLALSLVIKTLSLLKRFDLSKKIKFKTTLTTKNNKKRTTISHHHWRNTSTTANKNLIIPQKKFETTLVKQVDQLLLPFVNTVSNFPVPYFSVLVLSAFTNNEYIYSSIRLLKTQNEFVSLFLAKYETP